MDDQDTIAAHAEFIHRFYTATVRDITGHHPGEPASQMAGVDEFIRLPSTHQAVHNVDENNWSQFLSSIPASVYGKFRKVVIQAWMMQERAKLDEVTESTSVPVDPSTLSPDGFEGQLITLQKVSCAFVCTTCESVHWMDSLVRHIVMEHGGSMSTVRLVSPRLLRRLLDAIGHVGDLAPIKEEFFEPILICECCDPTLSTFKTLGQMVSSLFAPSYKIITDGGPFS